MIPIFRLFPQIRAFFAFDDNLEKRRLTGGIIDTPVRNCTAALLRQIVALIAVPFNLLCDVVFVVFPLPSRPRASRPRFFRHSNLSRHGGARGLRGRWGLRHEQRSTSRQTCPGFQGCISGLARPRSTAFSLAIVPDLCLASRALGCALLAQI